MSSVGVNLSTAISETMPNGVDFRFPHLNLSFDSSRSGCVTPEAPVDGLRKCITFVESDEFEEIMTETIADADTIPVTFRTEAPISFDASTKQANRIYGPGSHVQISL